MFLSHLTVFYSLHVPLRSLPQGRDIEPAGVLQTLADISVDMDGITPCLTQSILFQITLIPEHSWGVHHDFRIARTQVEGILWCLLAGKA